MTDDEQRQLDEALSKTMAGAIQALGNAFIQLGTAIRSAASKTLGLAERLEQERKDNG